MNLYTKPIRKAFEELAYGAAGRNSFKIIDHKVNKPTMPPNWLMKPEQTRGHVTAFIVFLAICFILFTGFILLFFKITI